MAKRTATPDASTRSAGAIREIVCCLEVMTLGGGLSREETSDVVC